MEIIKRIDSDVLIIKELKKFLGKKVKINIEVLNENQTGLDNPAELGRYRLGKELDKINLRDFAYEEN